MAQSLAWCRLSFLILNIHLQLMICQFFATTDFLWFCQTPRCIILWNSFLMASRHRFRSIGSGWYHASWNVVSTSALVLIPPINASMVSAASSNLISSILQSWTRQWPLAQRYYIYISICSVINLVVAAVQVARWDLQTLLGFLLFKSLSIHCVAAVLPVPLYQKIWSLNLLLPDLVDRCCRK